MPSKVTGEVIQSFSGEAVRYVATYELTLRGVAYTADAVFGTRASRLVQGLITWGMKALPPAKRVHEAVHDSVQILDLGKLKARAQESTASEA